MLKFVFQFKMQVFIWNTLVFYSIPNDKFLKQETSNFDFMLLLSNVKCNLTLVLSRWQKVRICKDLIVFVNTYVVSFCKNKITPYNFNTQQFFLSKYFTCKNDV